MKDCEGRNVGIDLGKRTHETKIIWKDGKVTGTNGKTSPEGRKKLYALLRARDRVAIAVCTLGMGMAKEIKERYDDDTTTSIPGPCGADVTGTAAH